MTEVRATSVAQPEHGDERVPESATKNRVAPEIARSWLLVSAAHPDRFTAASTSRADQVILDLEDAVDPAHKAAARANITDWFGEGHQAWVRINDLTSDFWEEDISALRGAVGLLGVVLAKTETAAQVTDAWHLLHARTPIVPLVESACGIEAATEIARAKGAFRLAFGSGDYRRDTGASADDLAMAYPRTRLVVASRIGDLPGPIDGPTVGSTHSILRTQSQTAVSLGLTGKLCLDAEQVPVINEVISPATSEIDWAETFLRDFEERGRVVRDGSDPPRLARAEKIMRLAAALTA